MYQSRLELYCHKILVHGLESRPAILKENIYMMVYLGHLGISQLETSGSVLIGCTGEHLRVMMMMSKQDQSESSYWEVQDRTPYGAQVFQGRLPVSSLLWTPGAVIVHIIENH